MSDAVERAARALCENNGDDWDREGEPLTGYLDQARAAIRSLAEPDDAAIEAMARGLAESPDFAASGMEPRDLLVEARAAHVALFTHILGGDHA